MNTEIKTLDFIIIGAQKSATTTLFKYLVEHPAIYMPPEKEIPFFSQDEHYEKGINWFLRGVFGDAPKDKLWGKATPHYMTCAKVPGRIFQTLPQVKLIAILRDPTSRARSHYKMSVRRQLEKRTFDDAIRAQLKVEALEKARLYPAETDCYIVWGEYGRILSQYLQHFSLEQLLILFTYDLEHTPEDVMKQIYDFLNVEVRMPKNLGKKFHQGGMKKRFLWVSQLVRETPILLAIWNLFPNRIQRRLWYRYEHWTTIPDQVQPTLTPETFCMLQEHYKKDSAILQSITHLSPPW